jgi:hypothetical protein
LLAGLAWLGACRARSRRQRQSTGPA